MNLEPDYKRTFRKVQYMPNSRTLTFFIDAEVVELLLDDGTRLIEFETNIVQVRVLLVIVGDEEHPTTGRRWHDRVKESVKYIGRTLVPFAFVWDIFFEMLMQV